MLKARLEESQHCSVWAFVSLGHFESQDGGCGVCERGRGVVEIQVWMRAVFQKSARVRAILAARSASVYGGKGRA